jgi:hypothetical protein
LRGSVLGSKAMIRAALRFPLSISHSAVTFPQARLWPNLFLAFLSLFVRMC